MAVIGLVWLFATGTMTYAAGEKLTTPATAPAPVATPRPTLIVPDVSGQAFVFAKGILEDGGFGWRVTGSVQGYATNVVVSQEPAAGTRVKDTGAPTLKLTMRRGSYPQDSRPKTKAKPAAKRARPAQPKRKVAKPKHKLTVTSRPRAFVVRGAPREPLNEIPLTVRARNLEIWLAPGRRATTANVRHWLYQHAWIVTGARFGWWHGAQALQTLIRVDNRVEARWGMGLRSEAIARAALAQVEAKSR